MPKYSNFAIVISFFCLWLNSHLSNFYQILLGFILIFSFGILHGANDLVLIKNLNKSKNVMFFSTILIYYVIIVMIGVALFTYCPLFALILFILVSGYHFGEQQLQILENNSTRFKSSFQLFYGLFILFLLFYFHQQEVQEIVQQITQFKVPLIYISQSLKVISVMLFGFLLYLYIYVEKLRTQIFLEVFYLLVFGIIFRLSSLIWGFAIYFIIWHSIPSMIDQIKFLHQGVTLNNFKLYFKSAFWYWIVSLIGIALLYYIFKDEKIFNALFFSFLAAITFPHVLVIIKMFGRKD